jgi:hypothetical protein
MDGFLIIARCGIDDIPLRLEPTLSLALAKARTVMREQVLAIAREQFFLDTSILYGVDVVEFKDGAVVGSLSVIDLAETNPA